MAAPITWRNIEGPSTAGAMRGLESVGSSINSSFDIFGKLLNQRQSIEDGNVAALDTAAQQAYVDRLAQAKTPEEVAALQASGELDRMRQDMTVAARRGILGADEARLTGTRQAALASTAYNDTQLDRAETPERAEVTRMLTQGNFDGATAFVDMSQIRDKAPLYAAVAKARADAANLARTKLVQSREDTTAARNAELAQLQLDEAKRAAAEAGRQRTVGTAAEAEIADFQARALERRQQTDALFRGFEEQGFKDSEGLPMVIPRNPDGTVNFGAIGKGLRGKLEGYLADNNAQTLDEIAGSDTVERRRATEKLRTAGATTADLARLQPTLDVGLNTTPQALTGADLARAERSQRLENAALEDAAKQFVPMSDVSGSAAVANTVFAEIDKRFGGDTWKAEAWRVATDKFLKQGIEAKDAQGKPIKGADGRPVKVIPSAETLLRMLGTVDTGVVPFLGARYNARDLEKTFEDYLKDENVYRAAGQAVNASLVRSVRGIDPLPQKEEPKKK